MDEQLKRCDNPACRRHIRIGICYCCASCSLAHTRGYEIHDSGPFAHSGWCDRRHKERMMALPEWMREGYL